MSFNVDLHCHSLFSDGELSPQLIIERAKKANINLLSITDHDTIDGLISLQNAQFDCLKLITGVEISARFKKVDIHILGYNFNINDVSLQNFLAQQQHLRLNRAKLIASQLAKLDILNTFEDAQKNACGHIITRPHFAQVLVDRGHARNLQDAFNKFLKKGRSAYVPIDWPEIGTVVSVINKACGHAVIAHPLKYRMTMTKLIELLSVFQQHGGAGIEVISGNISQQEIERLVYLCHKFDLKASSGSDYHRDASSTVLLGQQKKLPMHCQPIWELWHD